MRPLSRKAKEPGRVREPERSAPHYFTPHPTAKRDPRVVRFACRGVELDLLTDTNVFSKSRVDSGTRLLIENLRLPEEGPVLDLGCGYGPIGLSVARLRPDLHVYMTDVNRRAVELARENAERNGIRNVEALPGDGFESLPQGIRLTAVYTNPPYRAGKTVVYRLIEEAAGFMPSGAALTLVGRTKQGIKSLQEHLEEVMGSVRVLAKGGGYRVLEAIKK